MFGFAPISSIPLHTSVPAEEGPYARPSNAAADLKFAGAYTAPSSTAADLTFFVVESQPVTAIAPVAQFGTPLAVYNRFEDATGFSPTQFGAPRFGVTVVATSITPNTKLGAPPLFGPNILQIIGNGADGETTFLDESPYYAAVTRNGSIAKSTAHSRFGSGSISLTGASTANNLTVAANKRFNFTGVPAFTIEADIYLNAYNASGGRLLSAGGGANGFLVTNGGLWLLQSTATGVSFSWLWYGFNGTYWEWAVQSLSATLALSTDAQVKITFDGTTVRMFMDGVFVGSSTKPMTIYAGSTTYPVAVSIGAFVGEPTGATNAANAYVQQIRIRRDCTDTIAFSAPTAGLPSWIGELDGIPPTTQVPTPRSIRIQPVSGFIPTQFGTAFGQNLQRPTGFQTGTVGDPRIFPYSTVPFNSTVFGLARLFPFHVGPGIHSVQLGAVTGWQHWDMVWSAPTARFGTPTTPTNRLQTASGFRSTHIGSSSSFRYAPPNLSQLGRPYGFRNTAAGMPRATWGQTEQASGLLGSHLGTPYSFKGLPATGFVATALGTPLALTTHHASAFRSTTLGLPRARLLQVASGAAHRARFGTPSVMRSDWYPTYGFLTTKFGYPTGFSRFNYPVTGFTGGYLSTPTCHQRHRVLAIPPCARLGTPLLKRITQC